MAIDELKFNAALLELSELGLNVFASSEVSKLSGPVAEALLEAGVPLKHYQSLGVFGHGGRRLWENLAKPVREKGDPVDTFSVEAFKKFILQIAPASETLLLYPTATFVVPLQRLGRHLNLGRASPLGLDLNQRYGPWFAYRVAFLSSEILPSRLPAAFESPCDACAEKPCLTACPPRATGLPFRMNECADFRLEAASPCAGRCLAREACPYGKEHRYTEEQTLYHMMPLGRLKAFMGAPE